MHFLEISSPTQPGAPEVEKNRHLIYLLSCSLEKQIGLSRETVSGPAKPCLSPSTLSIIKAPLRFCGSLSPVPTRSQVTPPLGPIKVCSLTMYFLHLLPLPKIMPSPFLPVDLAACQSSCFHLHVFPSLWRLTKPVFPAVSPSSFPSTAGKVSHAVTSAVFTYSLTQIQHFTVVRKEEYNLRPLGFSF